MNDRRSSYWRDHETVALLLALLSALALLTLPPAPARAQGNCVFYSDYNSELYMRFPSSNFISGEFMIYGDDSCQGEATSGLVTGPLGYVRAPSQTAAASVCADVHHREMEAYRDFTRYSSQEIWWCRDPDAQSTVNGEERPSSRQPAGDKSREKRDADTGAPTAHTCETLVRTTDLKMTATYGLSSGIQCRRIGAAGIYDAAITTQGVKDAVDIFGYAEQGYQLCFPQTGRIIFLDAATAPRAVVQADFSYSGGFTCAALDRAGTVVLVDAPPALVSTGATAGIARRETTQLIKPGTDDAPGSAIPLRRCMVTPAATLRLRTMPWGRSLGLVWEGSTASASARTRSWYKVRHEGRDGWIAAWLTASEGGCSGAGPGYAARPLISQRAGYAALATGA